MAVLSVVSRLGAASAPWIAQYLGYVNKYLPFGVMGALCLLSAFFCMKLQETAGMPTAETLQDVASKVPLNLLVAFQMSCHVRCSVDITNMSRSFVF